MRCSNWHIISVLNVKQLILEVKRTVFALKKKANNSNLKNSFVVHAPLLVLLVCKTVNLMERTLSNLNVNSAALLLNGSAGEQLISVILVTNVNAKAIMSARRSQASCLNVKVEVSAHSELISIHQMELSTLWVVQFAETLKITKRTSEAK